MIPRKDDRCHLQRNVDGEKAVRLKALIVQLGITAKPNCGCGAMTAKMTQWGPDGYEQHLDEIVAHLRKAYAEQSMVDRVKAKAAAVTTGLAFQLDWADPIPSLVRLAIAEQAANNGGLFHEEQLKS